MSLAGRWIADAERCRHVIVAGIIVIDHREQRPVIVAEVVHQVVQAVD